MRILTITSLLLVLLLITLSSYLRLDHSGIGCTPWPECYAHLGEERGNTALHERLIEDATDAQSWATPLHRLVATVLGFLVLSMTFFALCDRRHRRLTAILLCLTFLLAVLGARSGTLRSPAIIMGNLLGGFTMLGLLGWMLFRAGSAAVRRPALRGIAATALLVLCLQIAIGGLTSANFAASACSTLPDCNGSWLPGGDLAIALDLTRAHVIDDYGFVVGGRERADIHKLHRLMAVAALGSILAAGVAAIRAGQTLRAVGAVLILLVCIEVSVGVMAVFSKLPIGLAVAHNGLAALLLLGLLKLLADAQAAAR